MATGNGNTFCLDMHSGRPSGSTSSLEDLVRTVLTNFPDDPSLGAVETPAPDPHLAPGISFVAGTPEHLLNPRNMNDPTLTELPGELFAEEAQEGEVDSLFGDEVTVSDQVDNASSSESESSESEEEGEDDEGDEGEEGEGK